MSFTSISDEDRIYLKLRYGESFHEFMETITDTQYIDYFFLFKLDMDEESNFDSFGPIQNLNNDYFMAGYKVNNSSCYICGIDPQKIKYRSLVCVMEKELLSLKQSEIVQMSYINSITSKNFIC